jgi:hypothetical protein
VSAESEIRNGSMNKEKKWNTGKRETRETLGHPTSGLFAEAESAKQQLNKELEEH